MLQALKELRSSTLNRVFTATCQMSYTNYLDVNKSPYRVLTRLIGAVTYQSISFYLAAGWCTVQQCASVLSLPDWLLVSSTLNGHPLWYMRRSEAEDYGGVSFPHFKFCTLLNIRYIMLGHRLYYACPHA